MFIVGIGGTTRAGSSSEVALHSALEAARHTGAWTRCFAANELQLPLYNPESDTRTAEAVALVKALAAADGVIISSPGYHGSMSGLVKNALDYVEDLRGADRPYLDGLPIGCISVAYGWQAAVNTLRALRDVAHALRGWPTPYGAAINVADGVFAEGRCTAPQVVENLWLVGYQCAQFSGARDERVLREVKGNEGEDRPSLASVLYGLCDPINTYPLL